MDKLYGARAPSVAAPAGISDANHWLGAWPALNHIQINPTWPGPLTAAPHWLPWCHNQSAVPKPQPPLQKPATGAIQCVILGSFKALESPAAAVGAAASVAHQGWQTHLHLFDEPTARLHVLCWAHSLQVRLEVASRADQQHSLFC